MSTKADAAPAASKIDPRATTAAIVGAGVGFVLSYMLKNHWRFEGPMWGAVFGGIGGGVGAAVLRSIYHCIRTRILLYATTIFVSAFLVFQVQPIIGKFILPWFGGAPGVWSTVILFFSALLLGGYLYAHLLVTFFDERMQGVVHLVAIGLAMLMLALFFPPGDVWKPAGDGNPAAQILLLLGATVGIPYMLISSTGPLMQKWFSETHPGTSPYRLYALSNVGSLLGLVSYPFLVEPVWTLKQQALEWTTLYAVFAVTCAVCAWRIIGHGKAQADEIETGTLTRKERREAEAAAKERKPDRKQQRQAAAEKAEQPKRPSIYDMALWLALAAAGNALLVATNNQLCMDVAAVPFLFVLVLSLFLLTFIICFDNPAWYSRTWFAMALVVSIVSTVMVVEQGVNLDDLTLKFWPWSAEEPLVISSLKLQIVVYAFMLFVGCMVCHGELVQLKPEPKYLTLFFLMVSLGGAIGGTLVTLVAPQVFDGFWEYHICLLAVPALLGLVSLRDLLKQINTPRPAYEWSLIGVVGFAAIVGLSKLTSTLLAEVADTKKQVIEMTRNFYGVLKVTAEPEDDPTTPEIETNKFTLTHGRIMHGFQFTDERKHTSTSYYSPNSGVGLAVQYHPRRINEPHRLRIGVIGLGTGTMATYAQGPQMPGDRAGDYLRFYDINPQVVRLADSSFSYLQGARDRGADVDASPDMPVFLGDARLVMERQVKEGNSQQFDVLVVDAFSSDAIPVHLLTEECSAIYWQQLKPDGILAIHISNRYLDLAPIVLWLAENDSKSSFRIHNWDDESLGHDSSEWILVTSNADFIRTIELMEVAEDEVSKRQVKWTDDFSNLLEVLDD